MTLVLLAIFGACFPGTEHDDVCVDDLVYRLPHTSALDLNAPYGMQGSHLTLMPNGLNPARANERAYKATLVSCYDGDTCTFDVHLPAFGTYPVDAAQMDFGLGVLVDRPTSPYRPVPWTWPIAKRVNQHVRLCDINAPELHPGPNAKAIKARDDLVKWIKDAKSVVLRVPQNVHGDMYEKYGRLLVYIEADGVNLNEKQLKHGNAVRFIQCK